MNHEILRYLYKVKKFNHLAFKDVVEIAYEINGAIESTKEKYVEYKTDFDAIRKAKDMLAEETEKEAILHIE